MSKKLPKINISSVEQAETGGGVSSRKNPLGIGKWLLRMNEVEHKQITPGTEFIDDTELARHKDPNDMWMALPHEGKLGVFDVTPFAPYHPGGFDILLQNAGTDATEAYRLAHSYVSVDMIGKLRKGFLRKTKRGIHGGSKHLLPTTAFMRFTFPEPTKPRWNWAVLDDHVVSLRVCLIDFHTATASPSWYDKLRIMAKWNRPASSKQGVLFLRTRLGQTYHVLELRLSPLLSPDLSSIEFESGQSEKQVAYTIKLLKQSPPSGAKQRAQLQSTIGSVVNDELTPTNAPVDSDDNFIEGHVTDTQRLTGSLYRLLKIGWPAESVWMPVPVGHHVLLKLKDDSGAWVVRPYTPVCDRFDFCTRPAQQPMVSGNSLSLLIKIYPKGRMSNLIDRLQPGDIVHISYPTGKVHVNFLTELSTTPSLSSSEFPFECVFILAAGSGITPMLRPIELILFDWLHTTSEREGSSTLLSSVHTIWFDRTESDQILLKEMDDLVNRFPERFSLRRVLSDSTNVNLIKGLISEEICRTGLFTLHLAKVQPVDVIHKILWLICGPTGFHESALGIARHWKVPESHIVEFKA